MQGTVAHHTQVQYAFRIKKLTWALLSFICLFVVVVVVVVVVIVSTKFFLQSKVISRNKFSSLLACCTLYFCNWYG